MNPFRLRGGWYLLVLCLGLSSTFARGAEPPPFPTDALRDLLGTDGIVDGTINDERKTDPLQATVHEIPFEKFSRGSGGDRGLREEYFQSSTGKAAWFKADVPDDIDSRPHGLLVYLHGDGGSDYRWFFPRLQRIASRYGLIPIAVMSPTSNVNGPSWWWDAEANARFLHELLHNKILPKYNIDRGRVIFTGASGGPTFLNGPWIRYYAQYFRGGAVLFCGGLVKTSLPFKGSSSFIQGFPLFYYVGTSDFLYSGAQAAVSYYKSYGMKVHADWPAGVGHCQFTMDPLLEARVAILLGYPVKGFKKPHLP